LTTHIRDPLGVFCLLLVFSLIVSPLLRYGDKEAIGTEFCTAAKAFGVHQVRSAYMNHT
jgi:hypothetical protein